MANTVLIVAMNIVSRTSSNLLPPDTDVATLTNQDIKDREFGSKMVLVVEQMQCITIWLVKACLLLMYHRLTYAMHLPLFSRPSLSGVARLWKPTNANGVQNEFETEPRCQDSRWLRRIDVCHHGNPL